MLAKGKWLYYFLAVKYLKQQVVITPPPPKGNPMFYCICHIYLFNTVIISLTLFSAYSNSFAAAVAQWFRAFAPQAEGLVFESQLRYT